MPKGKKITEKMKAAIRHDKLQDPDITHQELANKYHVSRQTVTKILNHKVISAIKKSHSQTGSIQEINQVDDLLLILSDIIFKLKYNSMDATQARALGYLVKTYFDLLVDRGKVATTQLTDLSQLSIEELKAIASEQST